MSNDDPVIIEYEKIIREEDLSWLLLLDGSNIFDPIKAWFPKSKCVIDEKRNEIEVPEWLALEKDLI